MKQRGFTVIELITTVALLLVVGIVFVVQKNNVETSVRDDKRKVAINSMYYTLEKVYYPAHKSYPKALTPTVLPSVDPALFNDPRGTTLGKGGSDYRYEPTGCTATGCTSYSL